MAVPAGILVGQQLAVVVEEVFNGGMVVSCAPLGLRGALLKPIGYPVMMTPGSYLGNPLTLIHDHAYMEIPSDGSSSSVLALLRKPQPRAFWSPEHSTKKIIRCIPGKTISRWNSGKPHNMAAKGPKKLEASPLSTAATPLTNPQFPEGVRSACVLVDPPKSPSCMSVGVGGRRAKLMAYEKMVQRMEAVRLPPPVRVKKKPAKKDSVHSNGIKSGVNHSKSVTVRKSGVKVRLTPRPSNVKTSKSCPSSDKKMKSNHQTLNCRKKLDFPVAVTSSSLSPPVPSSVYSTSSCRSTPYSSPMSPCFSSPLSSDTIGSSSRVNRAGSDSGSSEVIDITGLSPVEKKSQRLYLKDFSIRLVSMDVGNSNH